MILPAKQRRTPRRKKKKIKRGEFRLFKGRGKGGGGKKKRGKKKPLKKKRENNEPEKELA